ARHREGTVPARGRRRGRGAGGGRGRARRARLPRRRRRAAGAAHRRPPLLHLLHRRRDRRGHRHDGHRRGRGGRGLRRLRVVSGAQPCSGFRRMNSAITTVTTPRAAESVNAAEVARAIPASSSPPPATVPAATRAITETISAAPAAPATCCTVPTIAEPCGYRSRGSAPSAVVISGVNTKASPSDITT